MFLLRKLLIILIMLSCVINKSKAQEKSLDIYVTLSLTNKTIDEVIDTIQKITGIFIAQTSSISSIKNRITVNLHNVPLKRLLDEALKSSGFTYTFFHNQIILQPIKDKSESINIYGYITEFDSVTPVSYATIFLKKYHSGIVADINGTFELDVSQEYFNDTLHISSLGYESLFIPVAEIMNKKPVHFYMKKKLYDIEPVFIEPANYRIMKVGNRKSRPSGSLYMDTHGQQAALFVSIEHNCCAKIKTLWYYLSEEGNTDAPFRVRVYEVDSATGKPGKDILSELLIIKPGKKSGWIPVDVRQFNLQISSPGFFIAMEGVFPNDYDFYIQGDDFTDISSSEADEEITDETPSIISYGQRLGYTRNRRNNNTWHYSLDHTWFQLRKQLFSIMVAADIIVYEYHLN